jgi:hypothetical protein
MKYYRIKPYQPAAVDYTAKNYSKCWTCRNACGGCSWSRDFQPVEGWKAEETYLAANRGHEESYHVYDCPAYVRG